MLRRICFCLAWSVLGVFVPLKTTQAGIVLFDLQGKAGTGLLPGNENTAVTGSPGTGGERLTGISFDDVSRILTINVGWGSANGFTNLTGNATVGHIHGFTTSGGVASFTENASARYSLDSLPGWNNSATAGGFIGSIVIPLADVAALLNGQSYINIHTTTNGPGEIRGNLVVVPEPPSVALVALAGLPVVIARMRARRKSLAS